MGNYLKKPIIDEAVQSGRLGNVNYASNTIQVSNSELGLDLGTCTFGTRLWNYWAFGNCREIALTRIAMTGP